MRILILESLSGLRTEIDPRLLPEGFAMLRTMLNEFSTAGFEVFTVLNKRLEGFRRWFQADVILDGGLKEALKLKPDIALVIAPEGKGELERITTRLRRNRVKVLGPNEKAIRISGDKWLTYLALKGRVNQPKTWNTLPEFDGKLLKKPLDGVGCEGIEFFSSAPTDRVIFQEFVKGEHASCCLLMHRGDGTVLSVNKQEIKVSDGRFSYSGSEIPLEHERAKECAGIALDAAKALNLCGFCGVDLVVDEVPYVIELNPRVTTSFIALPRVLKRNLGEILIDTLVDGAPVSEPKLRGHSLVRILRAGLDLEVDVGELDGLQELPGIAAPPLALDGRVKKGSAIFVAVGSGKSARGAERDLRHTVLEACALLGVEADAIARA